MHEILVLFKDGYHVYYYSDEIEELATPLFQDKPFIRNYQLEVQGHTTTTEWNGKESVEEYLKKREYEIETSIYLNDGKNRRGICRRNFPYHAGNCRK